MNLQRLFLIHALVTFAAALVLIFAPGLIPGTVDITMNEGQYLLCYFLGAAELGIAYLSFQSRAITDRQALQIIAITFIIFHISTGLLELYALFQGMSLKLIGNIILRIVISFLFYYYGVYKLRRQE